MQGNTIKTRVLIQFFLSAGLACSISLPAGAENINPQNTSLAADQQENRHGLAEVPADRHGEKHDQWQKMSAEERMQRRKAMREHWGKMSPEEREQMRNKMRERWKNMPPQEREQRRREMREHFKNMSPEERQQFKRDMGERKGMPSSPVDDHPEK